MKTIFDHIEYVKGKPHHIRKQVAFGIAALGSALIALVWLAGSFATGAFAIQGSTFADSAGVPSAIVTTSGADTQGLAGAAASNGGDTVPAHIEIIDTTPEAPVAKQSEQTILPF